MRIVDTFARGAQPRSFMAEPAEINSSWPPPDLIDPTLAVRYGRVVKRTGDGALVEFPSVVDAVRCAIEIQGAMVERNADAPTDRRIEFRIVQWPPNVSVLRRRRFPVGASPIRRQLRPEATGAVMEVTKWLKPSV